MRSHSVKGGLSTKGQIKERGPELEPPPRLSLGERPTQQRRVRATLKRSRVVT